MVKTNLKIYQSVLDGLYASGLGRLAAPVTRGQGCIFTLHQVRPGEAGPFSPNSILRVTPAFLEQTIRIVLDEGYDVISLDEVPARLRAPVSDSRPFVVFTFDDGYRDNRDHALPIFEKYNIPMTLYIVSDYSSHQGELWWLALEEIIAAHEKVEDPIKEGLIHECGTVEQKYTAFDHIYWQLRHADQPWQRQIIRKMAATHGYDIEALTAREIMSWEELRELDKHPLVHLAAHTKSHYALAHLSPAEARHEVEEGLRVMEKELGFSPKHFSYPYGDRQSADQRDFALLKELGFETAVTTRKGVLHQAHQEHLTALPRISLNGEYQKRRYVELFLTGLPFRLNNLGRILNVT